MYLTWLEAEQIVAQKTVRLEWSDVDENLTMTLSGVNRPSFYDLLTSYSNTHTFFQLKANVEPQH